MSPKRVLTDSDIQAIDDLVRLRIKENNQILKSDYRLKQEKIITMLQELMGEVKAEREENTILEDRSSENRKRIEKVESHLNLSIS